MICSTCDTERSTKVTAAANERLPRGWKRLNDDVFCPKCWELSFALRAITIPIVGPLDPADWPDFRAATQKAWTQCTSLANWLTTELYVRDKKRTPSMKKLPAMESVYLYPEARRRFPDLSPRSVATMEHKFTAKYRSLRYKVLWTGEASLPNYRYPVAFPVPSRVWSASFGRNNKPLVDIQLLDCRWILVLRGGPSFRIQLRQLRELVEGKAEKGELSLYRIRANSNDNRGGSTERDSNGKRVYYRFMVKIVGWFPKSQHPRRRGKRIRLQTRTESFLVATNDNGESIWILNADHLPQWSAAYRRRLQRWNEDQKGGRRFKARFADRRTQACLKHERRIRSFCQESAAHFAAFARRTKVGVVKYDVSIRSYCDSFPWSQLRELLATKLDEMGIEFVTKKEQDDAYSELPSGDDKS